MPELSSHLLLELSFEEDPLQLSSEGVLFELSFEGVLLEEPLLEPSFELAGDAEPDPLSLPELASAAGVELELPESVEDPSVACLRLR